jgi:regulator of RNase E activity RraA
MTLDRALIERLEQYSTPSILNGLKRLGVPPAHMQTMDRNAVQCMAPALGARCGFAVTRTMATRREGGSGRGFDVPPDQGLLAIPGPRFLVVENVGDWQGPVCIWGELTAHVHTALDCRVGVTNGPVRDLPEMAALGFMAFSGGVGPGGGYVDLLAINQPVSVGGLEVTPGALVHGDQHGIVVIPDELAVELPDAIAAHDSYESAIFAVCKAQPIDLDALSAAIKP